MTPASPTRRRAVGRLVLVLLGAALIGATLVPSTFAAGPTAPTRNFVYGPTPTPIAGLPKHG